MPFEDEEQCRKKIKQLVQAFAVVELDMFLGLFNIDLEKHDKEALERDFTKEKFIELLSKKFPNKKCPRCQQKIPLKYLPLKYKLWLACNEMLEIKEQCTLIREDESAIVCLLTWLLAYPDANRAALDITEFEKWEWYSLNEGKIRPQRADAIQFLHKCEMFQVWQNLTCEAWQNIESKRITEAEREHSSEHINGPVATEQGEKWRNEVYQNNHQANYPYEISLLEEIADKLESWAEERKTGFESKIEEERQNENRNKTFGELLKEQDTFSSLVELCEFTSYFTLPDLSDEFEFAVKTFQFNKNFTPATMLVEIQNELYYKNIEITKLATDVSEYLDSYEPVSFEYKSLLLQVRTFFAVTVPDVAKKIRKVAEMTKKKMASGKLVKGPSVLAEGPSKPAETEHVIEAHKNLKAIHRALIKAMSKILKEGNITDITRDALVFKTNYSVGTGAINQAYIDLKTWGIITKDGQSFTPEFQHFKENPPN